MNSPNDRLNAEWVALNAFRGLTKLAVKGDLAKATYDNALDLGGELYPELLGREASILRRERESDTAKEYRQLARLRSLKLKTPITAVALIQADISDRQDLLAIAKANKDRNRVDQIKRRLALLIAAEEELNPVAHSEHQLIFRDALAVERVIPVLRSGKGFRDFELPDSKVLRVRVLHPDVPEHVTGADIIYERHAPAEEFASIVVVQYKIWEDEKLYLGNPRMQDQLARLRAFSCGGGVCTAPEDGAAYRFPFCAAFLRPTDKLQRADQAFVSTGEHLPLCHLANCSSRTVRGAEVLTYDSVREVSLSAEMFEQLFNKGKIGSRPLTYDQLKQLYAQHSVTSEDDTVVIYAQEVQAHGEAEN